MCGAAAAAGEDERANPEFAVLVGPTARLVHTAHFTVAYDTPDETVRALTARLEATYKQVETFCSINKLPFNAPTQPLEILFFDTLDGFYRYGESVGFDARGFNGFYYTRVNRSAFFNISRHPGLADMDRQMAEFKGQAASGSGEVKRQALKNLRILQGRREGFVERLNRVVIQHEAVHHLLYNVGVHVRGATNPQWFVEGMACIFETPPSGRGSGIGTTNQLRLADFREACMRERVSERLRPEDVRRALERGKFVPLRRLIGEPELLKSAADANLGNYYAQAWSLAFYLQRTQGKKLAEYAAGIAARPRGRETTGEEEITHFESVFGPLDEAFERHWAKFIFDLPFVSEL